MMFPSTTMSTTVQTGRLPGVIEIIYEGRVTPEVRLDAIRRSHALAGSVKIPVTIVDFRAAVWGLDPAESRVFQERLSAEEAVDYGFIIYVAGPDTAIPLRAEATLGNDLGRLVEVVGSVDEAYALLEDISAGE